MNRFLIALGRRFPEPIYGLAAVVRDTIAVQVAETEIVLCVDVARMGRPAIPLNRHVEVASSADTFMVTVTYNPLRF